MKFFRLKLIWLALLSTVPFITLRGQIPEGTKGMVATAHPLATESALEILKKGGNAVDAAIAAAFTIGVVEPDGSGIGGGGAMVIYLNDENKSYNINYYARASENGSQLNFSSKRDARTARSICVPGTVAGLTLAHEKFGSLPLETIIAPAIRIASEGFALDATLAKILLDNIETIMSNELAMEVFFKDGFPKMEGDTIYQKNLANTLKIIAKGGKKGFYEGPLAESIVKGIQDIGGVLTLNDFASYKAELGEPLYGTYRGYDIVSANIPQSGVSLIEALNILENYDFSNKPHFSQSAKILHFIAETERYVYADRYKFLGDPAFSEIPVSGLISKEYAKKQFDRINREKPDTTYKSVDAGNPYPFDPNNDEDNIKEGGHTTHLSVVDKDGNCVSLTQTLGNFFGSGQVVDGVLFNCAMTNFSYNSKNPNLYANGKQPRSTIMPTIILKDNNPFLVIGSPGAARIISTVIEVTVNLIDYKMDVQQANEAPRFYTSQSTNNLQIESGIGDEVRNELESMGHSIQVYKGIDLFFGGVQVIRIDQNNGIFYGSADPRRGGLAKGF